MEKERRQYFTLIELLAVMTIIAVLATIVTGVSNLAGTKAAVGKCKSQMQQIELALEQYKSEYGYFPQTDGDAIEISEEFVKGEKVNGDWHHGLQSSDANEKGDYLVNLSDLDFLGDNLVDPFKKPYRYRCPGDKNPQSYDLWSYGPDGKSSNEEEKKDNITNWSSN